MGEVWGDNWAVAFGLFWAGQSSRGVARHKVGIHAARHMAKDSARLRGLMAASQGKRVPQSLAQIAWLTQSVLTQPRPLLKPSLRTRRAHSRGRAW